MNFGLLPLENGLKIRDQNGNIFAYNNEKEVYECENRFKSLSNFRLFINQFCFFTANLIQIRILTDHYSV